MLEQLEAGHSVSASLASLARDRGASWRSLSAAWGIATTSGAPLAPALESFAQSLRDRSAAERDIAVALAGPRATARVVLLLPAVALGLALLLGVDLGAALTHPVGAVSIAAGVLLALLARSWTRRMLRRAAPPPPTIGLELDLLAVAAGGGGSPEAARRLVQSVLDAADLAPAPTCGDADDTAAVLVELSRRSGAPLASLARAEATQARLRARDEARRTAEDLGVRLMLPLGACVLPSFLLIGIVPMLVGLLSSTAPQAY
jgi:tight adherence protein B